MIFIHYGSKSFILSKFNTVRNDSFCKPSGGLWASSETAEKGWKDWAPREMSGFRSDRFFRFRLTDNARILYINSRMDMNELPFADVMYECIDFEQLAKKYDAIWLTDDGVRRLKHSVLDAWDVESLLVLNPEVICTIE